MMKPTDGTVSYGVPPSQGMTLLDYFAGQALNGIMADWSGFTDDDAKRAAEFSYQFAAAMLKARKAYIE